jgi:hypothetical protein
MALLVSYPKFHAQDASGAALVGGKLHTYIPGTTTDKATYSDIGLTIPNTNPVVLNSEGDATIYLNGAYDFALTDADDVPIWSMGNIGAASSSSYVVDVLATYGAGITYTDASIIAALTAIGLTTKATLLLQPGTWVITGSRDWSAYTNIVFKFAFGAVMSHGSYTVAIYNQPEAGAYTIFTGAGAVTITKYPQEQAWFGNAERVDATDIQVTSLSANTGKIVKVDANGKFVIGTNTDTQVAAGVTATHTRSHAITSTSDHTAGNWKIPYTNGSGQVIELALGANGYILQSNGAAAAPTFVNASLITVADGSITQAKLANDLVAGTAFTLASAPTEKTTTSATYVKLKEIQLHHGGTVTITFTQNGYGGTLSHSRIYKTSGAVQTAVGTEHTLTSDTLDHTYTEDLAFSGGDLIQLYGNTNYSMSVKNMLVQCGENRATVNTD